MKVQRDVLLPGAGKDMHLVATSHQLADHRVEVSFRAAAGDVALPNDANLHKRVTAKISWAHGRKDLSRRRAWQ
jgi:hypothetical protein